MVSARTALKLFALSVLAFAVAFALRRTFLWDVMPVSWDQPDQSTWALAAAFLLLSIENLAGVVGAITLALAAGLWFWKRRTLSVPKLRNGE